MDYSDIIYETRGPVALITLNRPDRLNAWTARMADELRAASFAAGADEAVRAIVITGAGRGFCAGADMGSLQQISPDGAAAEPAPAGAMPGGLALPPDFARRVTYLPTVPKPVICAINGPCAGIGLVYTLYADIRFAAEGARFTTAFARRGLVAEHGISWMLPQLVGMPHAFDLLLSGRLIEAAEAKRMNLVNDVFPLEGFLDRVLAYADELATLSSPRSMRVMKEQVWNARFQTLLEANVIGDDEMMKSFASEDFKEGIAHFVEKRPPNFSGR